MTSQENCLLSNFYTKSGENVERNLLNIRCIGTGTIEEGWRLGLRGAHRLSMLMVHIPLQSLTTRGTALPAEGIVQTTNATLYTTLIRLNKTDNTHYYELTTHQQQQ